MMSDERKTTDEVAWQQAWDDAKVFIAENNASKPKFYCLEMYPYPSGKMHMGHVRNYSIGDAVARYKRMKGFNVLYPIGFDSFGMPAENSAIAEGGHPHDITERNMASITEQIKRMGFSYDWNRMLKSHDPKYYKWNQLFFTRFFKSGLAYRKYAPVNWCDSCSTVLANEQVKAGRCWRCNGPVRQKDMSQWFIDITKYAQELLDGLKTIDFPDSVRSMQEDWLGRSEGVEIEFGIEDSDETIRVFTTRPDTLFGVTFVTLAPEHPLAEELVKGTDYEADWKAMYDVYANMSEFDRIKNLNKKEGVSLGKFAIHPLTGERIPIWAGNFVLASYGTGAVMAVPGHDERDFDFAQTYDLPIRRVLVEKEGGDAGEELDKAFTDDGYMVNSTSDGFDGRYGEDARDAVASALESMEKGERRVNWKIRPWLISRQRYWGTPIPIVHCTDCGAVPVPEDQLPVELPRDVVFDGKGNPLETSDSFLNTTCPECGKAAQRETDTMDTFVDSSWYFLRYTDATNHDSWYESDIADYWMNVDFYCGGIEHAQMHLIYARFYTKALRDLGFHTIDEPFSELLCQGMVNKGAPFCETCSITLSVNHAGSPCPHCGSELTQRSAKMSKSLGNTVSPEQMIEEFGADTVRLFILFAANPTAGMDWSDTALEANHRVMMQLQTMPEQLLAWDGASTTIDAWMMARLRQRVQQWTDAMERFDLRRAVECSHYDMVKDINWYVRRGGGNVEVGREVLEAWTHMIAVATPHLAEDWWSYLGGEGLLAAHTFTEMEPCSLEDQELLDGETLIRDLLEQARKVRSVAERHLEGEATSLTIITAAPWRYEMAEMALQHLAEGNNVKAFMGILTQSDLAQGEHRGERLGFWNKRMLPQVFKWDDEKKRILLSNLEENSIYRNSTDFIANELGLDSVDVVHGESEEDTTGKAGVAVPLSPAFIYA